MIEKYNLDLGSIYTVAIDEVSECPQCKRAIKPCYLTHKTFKDVGEGWHVAFLYLCKACYNPFYSFYSLYRGIDPSKFLSKIIYTEPTRFYEKQFDDNISSLSPGFVKIYNQALAAESYNLDEIAGMGYRKALEFLIKDFLISEKPDESDNIKGMLLGKCISDLVDDHNLKITAQRSAWLGNDHTHYIQKFIDKDIEDLKRLIKVTVHWVTMVLLTKEASEMDPQR